MEEKRFNKEETLTREAPIFVERMHHENDEDSPAPIRATFATDDPVPMFDYAQFRFVPQVLRMDAVAPVNQVPMLDSHRRESNADVIGSGRDIEVSDRKMTGTLVFDMEDPLGAATERKIRNGHITDVSIGYEVLEQEYIAPNTTRSISGVNYEGGSQGLNIVTSWRAKEISPTPIGADGAAKIREQAARAAGFSSVAEAAEKLSAKAEQQENKTDKDMSQEKSGATAPEQLEPLAESVGIRSRSEAITAAPSNDHERIREIAALGKRFDVPQEDIDLAELKGTSVEEFRNSLVSRLESRQSAPQIDQGIGLERKEVEQFSIRKAILDIRAGRGLQGLEAEVSEATAQKLDLERSPYSLHIPMDVLSSRDLEAGVAAEGGNTVQTDLGSMIDILRNRMTVVNAGATLLSGLRGNVALPKQDGAATASWVDEEGSVSETAQSFAQVTLNPQRLSARTVYSDLLVRQSSIAIENFVRDDLMRVTAIELDRTALHGSGVAPEPTGIENQTGVNTVTFGAAATWAKILEFEELIAVDNADFGTMSWITTPEVRGALKGAEKATNTAQFIWGSDNTVNGYRTFVTNQVASDKVVFGNFASLLIGSWGSQTVTVDPFSKAQTGQFVVTCSGFYDLAVRHGESFAISTDSGAQ